CRFAGGGWVVVEEAVHRRDHGRVCDAGAELRARVADTDLAAIPRNRHHVALECAEAVLEHFVRRLESPEEKGPVHHEERRSAMRAASILYARGCPSDVAATNPLDHAH